MSLKDSYVSPWDILPASITGASSTTDAINLGGLRAFGLVMPSSWTAACITFQMSPDGGTTWSNLRDQDGNEISATVDANHCVVLNPTQFAAIQHIRLRSGTAATPVNQATDRTIQILARNV